MTQQPKLQELKNRAFELAKELGLRCRTTQHFKKHVGSGLDLRSKAGWAKMIERLQSLASGVLVPHLLAA